MAEVLAMVNETDQLDKFSRLRRCCRCSSTARVGEQRLSNHCGA